MAPYGRLLWLRTAPSLGSSVPAVPSLRPGAVPGAGQRCFRAEPCQMRVGDGCGCPTQATTPPPFPARGQGGRRPLRLHTRRIVLPGPGRKDFLHPGQGMTWGIRVLPAQSRHGRAQRLRCPAKPHQAPPGSDPDSPCWNSPPGIRPHSAATAAGLCRLGVCGGAPAAPRAGRGLRPCGGAGMLP